jgi:signal transduction histidine kinase
MPVSELANGVFTRMGADASLGNVLEIETFLRRGPSLRAKIDMLLGDLPSLMRRNRRETALIMAAALILLFITGFSFWLTQRVLSDAEKADELNRFNARLTGFVQMLRTVESSQRGYLLTGAPEFLQPYNDMSSQLLPLSRELEADAPAPLKSAMTTADLAGPLSTKLQEMQQSIRLADSGRKDLAIQGLKDGRGLTTQIEEKVRKVQEQADALVGRDEATTRQLESIKVLIDGTGAILIMSFSFLSLWLLLRSNAAILEAQDALTRANEDLEETVEQRTAALKSANEEIQRFAYIVSHDLRSPLVNIMGFTAELETLRKDLFDKLGQANSLAGSESLSKDFDEAFGFIKSSIARMDRLIAAVLRISREGNRPLNAEFIDMKGFVDGLFAAVAHQVRDKDIKVEVGTLPPIMTDRLAIEQIFSNLIENAIKFLKSGAQGEIKVEGFGRGGDIIYTISDNGRGIDPRDHGRIFELFRRSGPQDVPGEGMGLAYVTALARRLGGTIAVESELGRGSVFKVTLPKSFGVQNRKAA